MQRILVSLSIIGVVAAFVVGGTIAYFHDVEIARENVFEVGILDLKTDDADGVTGVMSMLDMFPGQTTGNRTITLRNAGNINAAQLSVVFENTFDNFYYSEAEAKDPDVENFDGEAGNDEWEMAREMIVVNWWYGGTNLLATTGYDFDNGWVDAADRGGIHDNIITLNELERYSRTEGIGERGGPLRLAGINGGANINWIMNIRFDDDAPNELQGDELTMEIEFNLRQ